MKLALLLALAKLVAFCVAVWLWSLALRKFERIELHGAPLPAITEWISEPPYWILLLPILGLVWGSYIAYKQEETITNVLIFQQTIDLIIVFLFVFVLFASLLPFGVIN